MSVSYVISNVIQELHLVQNCRFRFWRNKGWSKMSASSVTHLNSISNYNWTEERQILDVNIDSNISFATILKKKNSPEGKKRLLVTGFVMIRDGGCS